jgi:hypothetical protein
MLRFLTDEDFDGRLTGALLERMPALDLARVQDVGLMQTPDEEILAWAAVHERIVLTHDRNTMSGSASARVRAEEPMPGLFIVDRRSSPGQSLDDLELMATASEMDEWRDRIVFIPL